mmetsp:Transcript_9111/g.26151  ORF Transcript_9111/g.26151 Transcript_9111/m.26151 type:complete len:564 (+) Transcript_9111:84-1775(+)|eukprot:CAMPEP_0170255240 /NCGR_PEP_ID=MMETSP0116_2-20130129/27473_1 /TAXON_ID=400756 /ORGANISM="Durinskia baltica, Strain CSIRO CS-38" /LENGTH=563 /DNA_ID=CAMNT_0010506249 /DNA_START=80 /DNA_END=1771 /DNA_ORIENTATION=-
MCSAGEGERLDGMHLGDAKKVALGLKVKNTFIDVNRDHVDEDFLLNAAHYIHRQISEPGPSIQRQISGPGALSPWRAGHADAALGPTETAAQLLEEEEFFDDSGDDAQRGPDEPEKEAEPTWFTSRGFGRQETEQLWPSWVEPGSAASAGEGLAAGGAGAKGLALSSPPHDILGDTPALTSGSDVQAAAQQPPPLEPPPPPPPMLVPPASWEIELGQPGAVAAAAVAAAAVTSASSGSSAARRAAGYRAPQTMPAYHGYGPPELSCGGGGGGGGGGGLEPPRDWASTTTVMMRNLPNKYTQSMLMDELAQAGFAGAYDFLYLPIDPETHANRGYAFLNLLNPGLAWEMKCFFEGRKMSCFNSDKVVTVAPAALQGFEANHAHYSNSRVNRGDPSARPLFLRSPMSGYGGTDNIPGGPAHSPARGARRRGGRRGTGSLIDIAARRQAQQHQVPPTVQPPIPQRPQQYSPQQPRQRQHREIQPSGAPNYAPGGLHSGDFLGHYDPALVSLGSMAGGAVLSDMEMPDFDRPPVLARFCPFCGGKAQQNFNFCSFCGSSLSMSAASI